MRAALFTNAGTGVPSCRSHRDPVIDLLVAPTLPECVIMDDYRRTCSSRVVDVGQVVPRLRLAEVTSAAETVHSLHLTVYLEPDSHAALLMPFRLLLRRYTAS